MSENSVISWCKGWFSVVIRKFLIPNSSLSSPAPLVVSKWQNTWIRFHKFDHDRPNTFYITNASFGWEDPSLENRFFCVSCATRFSSSRPRRTGNPELDISVFVLQDFAADEYAMTKWKLFTGVGEATQGLRNPIIYNLLLTCLVLEWNMTAA